MPRPGLWVAQGLPGDVTQMYSWQPGSIACRYKDLAANQVFDYKASRPDTPIIVRFQHPHGWRQNPAESARQLGEFVAAAWPQIKPLAPYVYFASHLNMHYENGDPDFRHQPNYTTPQFYQQYANWVRTTADIIKNAVPDMKLVTPPFAFGFNEDGSPDDNGSPINGWAGYDFLQETIRDYFDNTLTFHAYWGYPAGGSVPDWLYEPELSSWYAFRWQRVLKLFKQRYNLPANVIIDEAASFGPADPDFTDQLIYYANHCLSDERVLALTYYLWADTTGDPRAERNAWNLGVQDLTIHLDRLRQMPDVIPAGAGAAYPADATDLSGLMAFPEPAAPTPVSHITVTVAPPPPPPPDVTIRVLFEDGHIEAMPLEEYLRAVVAGEVPASWPPEALKAQAVAARTYAQYAIEHPRHKPEADICTTTHCQHYAPAKIDPRTDAAVQVTRGLVLRFEGRTINAVFSARCGGHTRNNEDVWTRGSPRPYLRGVPCPDTGDKAGHGIGLCQHGARVFAEQGRPYDEILKHYYQGVTIEPISTVNNAP